MPERKLIIDPASIDFEHIVADGDAIRAVLPQRGAMEQLTAIVVDDHERRICVGYRDLKMDEFWVPCHMPGLPLMPGVLICEAAAQVCTFQMQLHNLIQEEMIGFGGLDRVRFRGIVRPGDRLLVACRVLKLRPRRMVVCQFQAFVGANLVCDGELSGIPLPVDQLRATPT